MPASTDLTDLWLWPWKAALTNIALTETIMSAPAVIAARLPMIASAMTNPLTANSRELTRMVTEKADAFGQSQRSVTAVVRKMGTAGNANARDLNTLARGGQLMPADYMRMGERNLAAWVALMTLPGTALAPVHKRVSANRRRLHKAS
jgi:hypothetical protein